MPLVLTVVAGGVLSIAGLVLLLPLPELGLPLLLGGLRLLGRRYAWARTLNARVDGYASAARDRYHSQPRWVRVLTLVAVAALAVLLVYAAVHTIQS